MPSNTNAVPPPEAPDFASIKLIDYRKAWDTRLGRIDRELDELPPRIEAGYRVKASRLEPLGLVYLWPATG